MKPYFINVDFELCSIKDLSFLADELGNRIFILLNQKIETDYHFNFEMSIELDGVSPLAIIEAFLLMLECLSKDAIAAIEGCHKKSIDIGYNSGTVDWLYSSLPNQLLKKIVAHGFDINISIYGDSHKEKIKN